jgi:toxin ParE1/3/4
MSWRVEFAPQVELDVAEAADWYEARQPGLGVRFLEELAEVWNRLAENPMLNCRRHASKNIRWCHPERFPYRVVYEVNEPDRRVRVAAVVHDARREQHWQRRI